MSKLIVANLDAKLQLKADIAVCTHRA